MKCKKCGLDRNELLREAEKMKALMDRYHQGVDRLFASWKFQQALYELMLAMAESKPSKRRHR